MSSPVVEYRLSGLMQIVLGAVFAGVAAVVDSPLLAAGQLIGGALVFCAVSYLVAGRRQVRRVVTSARPVADAKVEAATALYARLGRMAVLLVLLGAGLAAAFASPALVGAIVAGNGLSFVLASRWLARWEHQQHAKVLREPRWRYMDARDFLVERVG